MLILSLVVREKGDAVLCCGRLGFWKQALLSYFGLDLMLSAHIQCVGGQREWDLGAMRSMAQISIPVLMSINFSFAIPPSRGPSQMS